MEQWYKLIEDEVQFYRLFEQYIQDIQDEMEENSQEISYPQTYATESGEYARVQMSVEQQVIRRIDAHEYWCNQLEKAKKRKDRFLKALDTLSPQEQQTVKEFGQVPTSILEKILLLFETERQALDRQLMNQYKSQFNQGVC